MLVLGHRRDSVAHPENTVAGTTWTADDPTGSRWVTDLGVDSVITDTPAPALAALGR